MNVIKFIFLIATVLVIEAKAEVQSQIVDGNTIINYSLKKVIL